MNTIRAIVRNRRIEAAAPEQFPDGTELLLRVDPNESEDDGPMSPEEIARVHEGMQKVLPLEIPDDVAAELDAWEGKLNQYGIENFEKGIEDVFR